MENQGNHFFRYICILFLTFIFSTLTYADSPHYTNIIFFGDSLSDNGNLYDADSGAMPKSPPYFQGRFSNGYVWTEYVAKYFYDKNFIGSTNLAVGGETTILHRPTDGYMPYTLTISIDKYLSHHRGKDLSDTLFIIWIGANDYLPGTNNADKLTTEVTGAIQFDIERLIDHGGKNFLMLNLPDLSKTPYAHDNGMEKILTDLTQLHNTKLNRVISDLHNKYTSINIHLFDVNALFLEVLNNIDVYNQKYQIHVTDTTTACLKSDNSFRANQDTSDNMKPCQHPEEHVFWDGVHPSAVTHMVFSQEILDYINKNYQSA